MSKKTEQPGLPIADYIRESGMSQTQFADKLGMKQPTLNKIIKSDRNVRVTEQPISKRRTRVSVDEHKHIGEWVEEIKL
jgi:predicted transcriptional regulator